MNDNRASYNEGFAAAIKDNKFFVYFVAEDEERYMEEFDDDEAVHNFQKTHKVLTVIHGKEVTQEFPDDSKI